MNDIPFVSNINIEDLLKDLDHSEARITVDTDTVTDTLTLSGNPFNNTTIGGGYAFGPSNISVTSPGTIGSNASPYAYNSTTGDPYTISSGAGTGISQPWSTSLSSKIKLDGEDADIEVNGRSLMDMIGKIEQRLNILHPNEKLEAEWQELRALGEQYRKLEQHIKDKQATWDKLKAMPPPVLD